jgi:hypothetical protein
LVKGRSTGEEASDRVFPTVETIGNRERDCSVESLRVRGYRAACASTLACLANLPGCQDGAVPSTFSPPGISSAYSDFKPEDEFRRRGFKVDPMSAGGRTSQREVYGWRPWQGSIQMPADSQGCNDVAVAIRDALNRAVGHMNCDELHVEHKRNPGQPLYGMLRYVYQGMRGQVYVWLFPDQSETRINYAILLREERESRNPFDEYQ